MSDLARAKTSRSAAGNRKPIKSGTQSKRGSKAPLRVAHPTMLSVRDLKKSYRKGSLEVPVLKGVDLTVQEGEFTAIIGQSGSGKSTLLHLLGTLDRPDSGEIWLGERRIDNLAAKQCEQLRNGEFGMIFQFYHLLPELTMFCLLYTSPSPRDGLLSRMPSSA